MPANQHENDVAACDPLVDPLNEVLPEPDRDVEEHLTCTAFAEDVGEKHCLGADILASVGQEDPGAGHEACPGTTSS